MACAGVIFAAIESRYLAASLSPFAADRLHHMYALTKRKSNCKTIQERFDDYAIPEPNSGRTAATISN